MTAGVDEAGRGPLAGPVVAAAVILAPGTRVRGLADSKLLAAPVRERLARMIRARSLCFGVGWADAAEVDALNILQATLLAMRRALLALPTPPVHVVVDGDRCPGVTGLAFECSIEAVVRGDGCVASVSAASILAKVTRDAFMRGPRRSISRLRARAAQGIRDARTSRGAASGSVLRRCIGARSRRYNRTSISEPGRCRASSISTFTRSTRWSTA